MTVKIKMAGKGTGIWKHMTNNYINELDIDKLTNYGLKSWKLFLFAITRMQETSTITTQYNFKSWCLNIGATTPWPWVKYFYEVSQTLVKKAIYTYENTNVPIINISGKTHFSRKHLELAVARNLWEAARAVCRALHIDPSYPWPPSLQALQVLWSPE